MDLVIIILGLVLVLVAFWIGKKIGERVKDREWREILPSERKDAIMKSRAVLGGQFSENLAPYLPDFPFLPTECRFVGKPIDFIVFKGMDEKQIREVVFVEVKSGNSKISSHERNLKEAIEKKRVRWVEYRIPKELTDKKDVEDRVKGFVE
jgi:predicted Holliday junction resolvase-like endonuclease